LFHTHFFSRGFFSTAAKSAPAAIRNAVTCRISQHAIWRLFQVLQILEVTVSADTSRNSPRLPVTPAGL